MSRLRDAMIADPETRRVELWRRWVQRNNTLFVLPPDVECDLPTLLHPDHRDEVTTLARELALLHPSLGLDAVHPSFDPRWCALLHWSLDGVDTRHQHRSVKEEPLARVEDGYLVRRIHI